VISLSLIIACLNVTQDNKPLPANPNITCKMYSETIKKIEKIPRKSYFLNRKFLKRVILMKWENVGAFLS
jgi:hypothetical protein